MKIKYRDDGRDFVSVTEFIAIHLTFSVLHSMLTYYVMYSLMYNLEIEFCNIDNDISDINIANCKIIGVQYLSWCIIAMWAIFIEMVIYLAYYKDVIFSFITCANYIGMLMYLLNPDDDNVKIDGYPN
mmetsp:Transcript_10322/g.7713  ORF Transcript_10322/g.7713 Transcript_10322/m.7713 type:complete len:128 (+) Transcript_10322:183-566(+)